MVNEASLLADVGLQIPRILLPAPGVDASAWAVVACDQYTSEPEYWEAVGRRVGTLPSTLRLIYPEVYLNEADGHDRVTRINDSMRQYLESGVLQINEPGFILVERHLPSGKKRLGLMVALDLERYDFSPGSTSLVRATEGTILDRLPPRIAIRKNAALELPHIMVLIDDPERTVIEPLQRAALDSAYDVALMQNGGRLTGRFVRAPALMEGIARALARLAQPEQMTKKYGSGDRGSFLYAMGDGNHSLATAKALWEEMKKSGTVDPDHPARFALVELVNLHDDSLEFEAIHRVLFHVESTRLFLEMESVLAQKGAKVGVTQESQDKLPALLAQNDGSGVQVIPFVSLQGWGALRITHSPHTLAVGALQNFLDGYLKTHGGDIDYVHGDETVVRLSASPDRLGLFLPSIAKHDLFRTVLRDGPLPRKAFSMGEAHEKRFYMEARRIAP